MTQPVDGYRKVTTPARGSNPRAEDAFPESCCEGVAAPYYGSPQARECVLTVLRRAFPEWTATRTISDEAGYTKVHVALILRALVQTGAVEHDHGVCEYGSFRKNIWRLRRR